MEAKTKQCKKCRQNFEIDQDDFSFYEKMKVCEPSFCAQCRSTRRLIFRNERSLYHRKCDITVRILSLYILPIINIRFMIKNIGILINLSQWIMVWIWILLDHF